MFCQVCCTSDLVTGHVSSVLSVLSFQAYFYEKLEECHDGYKPSFGGSMTELLLKINAAQRDDLLVESPPSTGEQPN